MDITNRDIPIVVIAKDLQGLHPCTLHPPPSSCMYSEFFVFIRIVATGSYSTLDLVQMEGPASTTSTMSWGDAPLLGIKYKYGYSRSMEQKQEICVLWLRELPNLAAGVQVLLSDCSKDARVQGRCPLSSRSKQVYAYVVIEVYLLVLASAWHKKTSGNSYNVL